VTAAAAPGGARIVSVNISPKKGQLKTPVASAEIVAGEGLAGDAHRGFAHRQVSLLMIEDIDAERARLGDPDGAGLGPGSYAENLTTRGLDLGALRIGDELTVGATVRLRVSQIGKECHTRCAVLKLTGSCIMPVRGVFCEALSGGPVRPGDAVDKR